MERKIKIVLDTNIFVNPDARYFWGKSTEEALTNLLIKLQKKENILCFIPPSVYNELMNFLSLQKLPANVTLIINKKPPSKYEISLPAIFLYEFIEEMRGRINKGLRIAEKYSRKGLKGVAEEELIKNLRSEYRTALREGIIDSKEDVDLLLLCKELNAYLVTSDQGLIKWAYKLGIPCLSPPELVNILEE